MTQQTDRERLDAILHERAEQTAQHIEREQPKLSAACISSDVWPRLIRELSDRIVALEHERDELAAEVEADTFRKAALQESLDHCAQRVRALADARRGLQTAVQTFLQEERERIAASRKLPMNQRLEAVASAATQAYEKVLGLLPDTAAGTTR